TASREKLLSLRFPSCLSIMSAITEEQIRSALTQVRYPGFSRDIVSFGLIKEVRVLEGNAVVVQMAVTTNDTAVPAAIREQSEAVLKALPGVSDVTIKIDVQAAPQVSHGAASGGPGSAATGIPGVKHIIAVASGKGGVGKST